MDITENPDTGTAGVASRSVKVQKAIPYEFDLGNLLCNDLNPVPPNPSESDFAAISRDCAQGLVNQLLTTCPIKAGPDGATLTLPAPTTLLPREKPLPEKKAETKWERFAREKGLRKKKKGQGKMVFDEASGEWVSKWGFGSGAKDRRDDWLVELPDREKDKDKGRDQAGDEDGNAHGRAKRSKKEASRKNERQRLGNQKRAQKPRRSGGK